MQRLIIILLLSISCPAIAAEDLGTVWGFFGDSQTDGRAPSGSCESSPECILSSWTSSSPSDHIAGLSGRSLDGTHTAYDGYGSKSSLSWVHLQESGNQNLTGQTSSSAFGTTFETAMTNIASDSSSAVISYETAFSFGREAESYRDWDTYNTQLYESVATLAESGITVVVADVDTNIKLLQEELTPAEVWYQDGDSNEYHYTAVGNFMVAMTVLNALGYDVNDLTLTGVTDVDADDKAAVLAIADQPIISSISGSVYGGSSVTISGIDFGTHGLDIDFAGPEIESQSVGEAVDHGRWHWEQSGATTDPDIVSSVVHSGSRAIYANIPYEDASIWRYQHDENIGFDEDIYVSWWVRKDRTGAGTGQWKMWRICYTDSYVDEDTPQMKWFDWGSYGQFFVAPGPGTSPVNNDDATPEDYLDSPWPDEDSQWYRAEIFIHTSSARGVADGSYTVSLYSPTDGTHEFHDGNDKYVTFNDSDGDYYRWIIWQNWISNETSAFTTEVWLDDPYVQIGTVARVELCEESSWTTRTNCDIQEPTEWATGEVTVTVNQGAFEDDDSAYLYVIDSDGAVNSSGFAVTIGAEANPPTHTGSGAFNF